MTHKTFGQDEDKNIRFLPRFGRREGVIPTSYFVYCINYEIIFEGDPCPPYIV